MKIRSKLIILSVLPLFVGSVLGITELWVDSRLAITIEQDKVINDMVRHIVELDLLSSDFLRNLDEERPRKQLKEKLEKVDLFILNSQQKMGQPANMTRIHDSLLSLRHLLQEKTLAGNIETPAKDQINERQRRRTIHRILVINQRMVIDVLHIKDQIAEESNRVHKFGDRILFSILVILILSTGIFTFTIGRHIIKSIDLLRQGTQKIGAGEFDFHLSNIGTDELGNLGRAFNMMTRNLKQSQKKLKESHREITILSQAIISSPVSVIITDSEGIIQYVNPKFSDVTGYRPEEVLGQNPKILKSGKQPSEFYKELWETILSGKDWQGNLQNRKKNGEIYWARVFIAPIVGTDNEIIRFVAIKEDITKRKETETTILDQVEELSDARLSLLNMMEDLEESKNESVEKVKELGRARRAMLNIMEDLKQARMDAEKAAQTKSQFLANMSHEIRTPMNAIIGLSQLALNTTMTPKQKDYLSKIDMSAKSLLTIINDILDLSKIEAGKLELESTDFRLDSVMDMVSGMIALIADEKGLELLIHLSPSIPVLLRGDPLRLAQVLINLSNNAVKFTDQGEVIIAANLSDRENNRVTLQFSVSDTGIGMDKNQVVELFEPFSQADASTTRQYGGSGLGLSICKQLVEMMKGEISIDSEPGKGSKISFTSVFRLQAGIGHETIIPPKEVLGLNALIIDDSTSAQKIFVEMLESFGMIATVANNGEEGLAILKKASISKTPFDLVLMDLKMPGMDGLEVSRLIKQDSTLPLIPTIIMVTAYGSEQIQHHAESIGIEGYLTKPVTPSTMLNTIIDIFHIEQTAGYMMEPDSDFFKTQIPWIQGARILLAEDNKINQQVAVELLENMGMIVEIVDNGKAAVKKVKQLKFDLVLMDILMPVMDGITATREIRRLKGPLADIPVIALTAHAMAGDREQSIQAGMNDHINKPVDPDSLSRVLVKWIEKTDRPLKNHKKKKAFEARLPAPIPGIDFSIGLKHLSGNKRLYLTLLRDFLKDGKEMMEALKDGIDNEETICDLTHTLQSMAGNLGVVAVQKAASELEVGVTQKSVNTKVLLENLDQELRPVLVELDNYFQMYQDKAIQPTGDRDETPLMQNVHKLIAYLKINDVRARDIFSRIHGAIQEALPLEAEVLEGKLKAFDFKGAHQMIESIKELLEKKSTRKEAGDG